MKLLNKEEAKTTENPNTPKILYFVVAIMLSFLLISLFDQEEEQTVPLSEIVQDINADQVKEITILEDRLIATYQDESEQRALKEPSQGITESLLNLGVSEEKLAGLTVGFKQEKDIWTWLGPLLLALLPPLLILFIFWKLFSKANTNAVQAFDFTKTKARLFGTGGEKQKEKTTFNNIGGLEQAKEELKEIVDFLKNPEKYFNIGAKIPRGVLLVGPPGTGKTLLARAVAEEAGVPFFSISGSEFIELFVGVGASRVRSLFSQAKKVGKAIIFIDEIDSIGKARGTGLRGGGLEEREQTLNQILSEMDGFEKTSGVIVMGATNKPEALDHALLRPGRFDRHVKLDLPDINDREKILEIHAKGKPLSPLVKLREIAERTPGFSGADLESLLNEAAILTARKNKKEVSQSYVLDSIEKVMLGPERKSHLLSKEEKKIAAFHEAGHAVLAASLGTEKVRKVSIIARGMAAGYTLKAPEQEKRMKTKSYFLEEITILFGGLVAEKMQFGEISTGAANDLKKASALARRLVTTYGMSSLGAISLDQSDEPGFLEELLSRGRGYSEETAAKIDHEIVSILSEQRKRAKSILADKKEILGILSNQLIKKETIEKEEFESIMKKNNVAPGV